LIWIALGGLLFCFSDCRRYGFCFTQKANAYLDGEIRGLEMAIKAIVESDPKQMAAAVKSVGLYADASLTEAVLHIVNSIGLPPGISCSRIVELLKSQGFKSKAQDLYTSAYGVAMGLVKRDRIAQGMNDGKRTFLRKT
jgi:hypothetical protein